VEGDEGPRTRTRRARGREVRTVMRRETPGTFRESQELVGHGLRLAIVFGAVFALTLGAYAVFAEAGRSRGGLLPLIAIGAVLTFLLVRMRLDVRVDDEQLRIDMPPLVHRTVPLHEIVSFQVTVRRLLEPHAGYSVGRHQRSYWMGSRSAIDITLRDGSRVVLGTRRPEDLAAAIRARLDPRHSTPQRRKP
jgi:hypothetical protein